jgi:hypothetical protein
MLTVNLLLECEVTLLKFNSDLIVQVVPQSNCLLLECEFLIVLLEESSASGRDLVEGLQMVLIPLDIGMQFGQFVLQFLVRTVAGQHELDVRIDLLEDWVFILFQL